MRTALPTEQAKSIIGHVWSTLNGQARLGPFVLGAARRNDFRITGHRPAALNTAFELIIVSMAFQ